MAITTNEIPREARICYANTHRFKTGIVRVDVQIYVEQYHRLVQMDVVDGRRYDQEGICWQYMQLCHAVYASCQ